MSRDPRAPRAKRRANGSRSHTASLDSPEDLSEQQLKFCRKFAETGNARRSSLDVGIDPATGYTWLDLRAIQDEIESIRREHREALQISQQAIAREHAEIGFDRSLSPSDRQKSLDSLARLLGYLVERVEHSWSGTEQELDAEIRRLLAKAQRSGLEIDVTPERPALVPHDDRSDPDPAVRSGD